MSPRWLIAIATAALLMIILANSIDAGTVDATTGNITLTVWDKLTYFQYANFVDPLGSSNFIVGIWQDITTAGAIIANFIDALFCILTWNYNFLNNAGVFGWIVRGLFTAITIGVLYTIFKEVRGAFSGT